MGQVGYRRTLFDGACCFLVYCLVNFQPGFLVGGFCKLLVSLVLAYLLAFVLIHRSDTFKLLAACLQSLPSALVPLVVDREWIGQARTTFAAPNEPILSLLFQRPPPILSLQ